MDATFNKAEKLKSKKLIAQLFETGKTVTAYPLKLVYLETQFEDDSLLKTGVSVSKRSFKKAVDRNRIKRLMREAYRLNKANYFNNTSKHYAFMILYLDKEMPNLKQLDSKMKTLLKRFLEKVS
jgi:ribonuclease P protein component